MKRIDTCDFQRLDLEDGTYLYLEVRHGPVEETGLTPDEFPRNVFRIKDSGEVLWRIASEFDYMGNPFTRLFIRNDPCIVRRWDDFIYRLDLETGWAVPFEFAK